MGVERRGRHQLPGGDHAAGDSVYEGIEGRLWRRACEVTGGLDAGLVDAEEGGG